MLEIVTHVAVAATLQVYRCSKCNATFDSIDDRIEHLSMHLRPETDLSDSCESEPLTPLPDLAADENDASESVNANPVVFNWSDLKHAYQVPHPDCFVVVIPRGSHTDS